MGPYILAKNFTFSLADDVQIFRGDWIPVDPQFENWSVLVHCQTLDPAAPTTGITVEIETSYDEVGIDTVGATTVSETGTRPPTAITEGMLGMARLKIKNIDNASITGTISVWLQPKSE